MPKRLRARAAAEIDAGSTIAKVQRKKAKLRARGNLRGESRTAQLLKRQREYMMCCWEIRTSPEGNKTWLPTHIYHAKRFHMVDIWSHRLALTPTLKSFRSAYRASRRRAIVHDTSYFGTIELEGNRNQLIAALSQVTGEPFAGAKYESGSTMADVTLYRPASFPLGFIGPAQLLWDATGKKIWLRLHPSIFTEAFDTLKTLIAGQAGSSAGLHIRDLRLDFGSFEIVGPQGGHILRRIFRVCRNESPARKMVGLTLWVVERVTHHRYSKTSKTQAW